MKILVISDSHGNIANLKHVLGFAKEIKAGAIIHCGDWNNIAAVETVLESGLPIYGVLGNADIDPALSNELQVTSDKFDEKFLEIEIEGRKIGIVHNVLHHTSPILDLNIIFCGHTHKQEERLMDGIRVVNPGALENNISFAVYNTADNQVEFVSLPKEGV